MTVGMPYSSVSVYESFICHVIEFLVENEETEYCIIRFIFYSVFKYTVVVNVKHSTY